MSTTFAATKAILVPVNKNKLPTVIELRQQPNGLYRWIGNDGNPYSPTGNNAPALSRRAATTGLTKQG